MKCIPPTKHLSKTGHKNRFLVEVSDLHQGYIYIYHTPTKNICQRTDRSFHVDVDGEIVPPKTGYYTPTHIRTHVKATFITGTAVPQTSVEDQRPTPFF